jgi:hypothetical protein
VVQEKCQHESGFSYEAEELVFFSVCLKLPTGLEEKLVASHQHVTEVHKMNCYILSQLGNGEKSPLCFDMTSNVIVNYMWTHRVVIRS